MDGMSKRTVNPAPIVGVALLLLGMALLWAVPALPEFVGIAAVVIGSLLLVNEFV